MDGGAWWATVHDVAKSRTQLSDFTSLPVFLPGKFHRQRILVSYRKSDMTEHAQHTCMCVCVCVCVCVYNMYKYIFFLSIVFIFLSILLGEKFFNIVGI